MLFGLRHPSTGVRPGLGAKDPRCLPPARVHVGEHSLLCPPPDFMNPERTTASPASPGDPPRPAGRSGPGSYGVTVFALSPNARQTLWAPSKSGDCFPQSCGAPAIKPHWPSKPNYLGAPPPDDRPLHWGAWHGAQSSHSCGRTSAI